MGGAAVCTRAMAAGDDLDSVAAGSCRHGFRRFRTAIVEWARKQGKSTWAAGIALYMTVADGEQGCGTYSVATKKEQARLVHGEAVRMVAKSPSLSKVLKRCRDNLHCLATNSKFEPLASEEDSLDGLNPHCIVADEVHAWSNRLLWDVLATAVGARRQPLMLAITTAGYDRHSVLSAARLFDQGAARNR